MGSYQKELVGGMMMGKVIKITAFEDGCEVDIIDCDMELETLQAEVDGYIEIATLPLRSKYEDTIYRMVVDEEGLLKDKPVAFCNGSMYIVGNIIICAEGWSEDGPELRPLRKREAIEILEYLSVVGRMVE